jgi:hypothetical protein
VQHLEMRELIMVMLVIVEPVSDTPEAVSAACSITVRCWAVVSTGRRNTLP